MSPFTQIVAAIGISTAVVGGGIYLSGGLEPAGATLEQIKDASFMLAENGMPICSGQFIDEDTFLTAAHCIRGTDTHPVYTIVVGDQQIPMTVVADVNSVDVAVLDVTGDQTFPFVPVAASFAGYMGQTVVNGHFPQVTGEFFFSFGHYLDTRPAPVGLTNANDTYAVTIENLPGSSGSGLYVEVAPGQYQLIGTLSGGFGLSFNFFASLEGIHPVIDAH